MKYDDTLRLHVHLEDYSFGSALELMKEAGVLMVLEPAVFREKQDSRLFFYAAGSAFPKEKYDGGLNFRQHMPMKNHSFRFCCELDKYVKKLEREEFYWIDFDYSIENAFVPFKPGSLLAGDLQHRRFKRVEWPLKFPAAINLVAWKRDRMLKVEIIEGQNFVEQVVEKFDDSTGSTDQEDKNTLDELSKKSFEVRTTPTLREQVDFVKEKYSRNFSSSLSDSKIKLKIESGDLPDTHMPMGPGLSYPVGYNKLADIPSVKKYREAFEVEVDKMDRPEKDPSSYHPVFKIFEGSIMAELVNAVLEFTDKHSHKHCFIGIKTSGGNPDFGSFLAKSLNRIKDRVSIVIIDYVMSAGFIILDEFQGDRYISETAVGMIHVTRIDIEVAENGNDYSDSAIGQRKQLQLFNEQTRKRLFPRLTEDEIQRFNECREVYFSHERLKSIWPNIQIW